MTKKLCAVSLFVLLFLPMSSRADIPITEDTQTCIDCHTSLNPGIIEGWKKSRMSKVTPASAREFPPSQRRVSFESLEKSLAHSVVGCAECHTLNPEDHRDTFDHNGFEVHMVVTPKDCATCHPVEAEQYGNNLMSHAYGNLQDNPVYRSLADSANGRHAVEDLESTVSKPDPGTDAESCFYCHGTVIDVKGSMTRETDDGEMTFPVLTGWPNRGVGRVNPDGSLGACSACHTRHQFSIAMARKPHTCSECHKGPDVPAYKVYNVSKHGNIFSAMGGDWTYENVPWVLGKDFTAPTCATCHVSLLTNEDGEVIADRTHQMNDRLAWRIFGLVYAHPHPKGPDTTVIRNAANLPLPTELTGEPVVKFLIDAEAQEERRKQMQTVCLSCHGTTWVEGQFARFENTIKTTNDMTLAATKILLTGWEKGTVKGLSRKDSIFNEVLEKKWVEQWLFYGNSTRYASAMLGADYGAFAHGRWYLSKNINEMLEHLKQRVKEDE